MTKKQRRALRRERAKLKRMKDIRKATAVNMQTVRAGAHTAAREKLPRFEVDSSLSWYVVRTLPRWASRAAEQIAAAGIPVFEAREAVRIVSDIGKVRTALIPVLRRILFVGVRDWRDLKRVEEHPGIYDDSTGYRRGGLVERPGGGPMVIAAEALQHFADQITGNGGDVLIARHVAFLVGQSVIVEDGPFASFPATVEEIDADRERFKLLVNVFGREVPVEMDARQVKVA